MTARRGAALAHAGLGSMKVTDEHIHDRATRGEALSDQEQVQLQQWYARLDQEENGQLNRAPSTTPLAELQTQIEVALAQLATVTARIQSLTAENAVLRLEVDSLRALVAQKSTPQPA
jgi:hypothetical protein